jgi:hypothetical protein
MVARRLDARRATLDALPPGAFPYLAPGGADSKAHMKDVGRLMASLGHADWAEDTRVRFGLPPLRSVYSGEV